MKCHPAFISTLILVAAGATFAAVIGTNVPATPLTAERVAGLPAWKNYYEFSQRQRAADQNFLRTELATHGLKESSEPKKVHNAGAVSLKHAAVWYGNAEARRIADVIVSFQTPAGGWSKNTDYTKNPRAPGEAFGAENGSFFLHTNEFDQTEVANWSYVGTFDNDATTTELRFLAKVISATKSNCDDLKKSFARGLAYIFAAQFPNGGWPQVWPLQGGYHDAITLNDDAMLQVVKFIRDVAERRDEFSFISPDLRARADLCWKRGLNCLLAAQIVVNGRHTVWCQQHDALTLAPTSARNYEMPAQTSSESAAIVLFLMQLPNPDAFTVAAVHAAAAWFEKTKIEDAQFTSTGAGGKKLVPSPGHAPVWARYYEIGTNRPLFGDRDKSIHDNVNEISHERRKGYGWYRDTPKRVLEHYPKWAEAHP